MRTNSTPRASRRVSERFTSLGNGAVIRVLEGGEGKPILFVHGWPTNANVWRPQIEALSVRQRVLAIDMRSFGQSTPAKTPTIEALSDDIEGFLEVEELEDVLLIGWSMGGTVVMDYCARVGQSRLRGIGIVDVSPRLIPSEDWPLGVGTPFSAETLHRWQRQWPDDRRSVADEVYTSGFKHVERHAAEREWLIEESLKADRASAMEILTNAFTCDFREALQRLEVPALLLYGGASTSTTKEVRDFMHRTIFRPTLVVFEESSHCLMIEEQQKFNRVVAEFAESL